MWQGYYCNAPPPGVSQTTCECCWNPNLGNGRPLKFVRLALSFWVRTVWIIFTARWPACISVASPCWCITLVQPWALDNWHCRISEDILLQVPPSCCSSANFTCPDLGLNPTAVLPQVEQHLATTHCVEHSSFSNLTSADGVWLLLRSVGGYSACSCSLSCSSCRLPVGRGIACLLPSKVLFSSDSDNSFIILTHT